MVEDIKALIKNQYSSMSTAQLLIVCLMVLPITVLLFYVYFITTDRYESHAAVYITEEQTQSNPLDLSLFGVASAGSRDILVLKTFIDSQGMMTRLNKDLDLLAHFSSEDADFFSRLSKDAPVEISYDHYLSRITTNFDDKAELLEISVQSFDKEYSKKVLDAILKHSQTFIDELNKKIQTSTLLFYGQAVKDSEADLIKVRKKLTTFQQKNAIFSTELASQTIAGTISGLERNLAQRQADLSSRLSVLDTTAPTVVRIQAEIDALQEQIAKETARLASDDVAALSELDSTFREIELEIEYKTLRFKSNLQAYEQARLDTARQLRFLTIVSPPTIAESSLYPNRLYIVITGSIIAIVIYFLVSISMSVIREHS